jgi:hypothetical protein
MNGGKIFSFCPKKLYSALFAVSESNKNPFSILMVLRITAASLVSRNAQNVHFARYSLRVSEFSDRHYIKHSIIFRSTSKKIFSRNKVKMRIAKKNFLHLETAGFIVGNHIYIS